MNIKKIIREEIDDFGWVRDISYEDTLDNHFNIETNGREAWFKGIIDRNNIHPAYGMYDNLTYNNWSSLYKIIDKDNKLWSIDRGIIKRLRIANKLDNWRIDRLDKLKDYYPKMYKKQLMYTTP